MKTKTLLIAAAALAATVISSQAQVYSGVVGYSTVNLTNGFNLVANQLDFDGTGTNNTVLTAIGTNLPAGSKVEGWDPISNTFKSIQLSGSGVWSAGAAGPFVKAGLQPGGGVFVFINGSTPTNITLVGQILQGTNKTTYPSQFQLASVPYPVSGTITSNTIGYAPNAPLAGVNDKVLLWRLSTQTFVTHQYNGSIWSSGTPNLNVGDAFFLIPNQTTSWTNALIVQ